MKKPHNALTSELINRNTSQNTIWRVAWQIMWQQCPLSVQNTSFWPSTSQYDCEEALLSHQHWYIKHGEWKLSAGVCIHLNDRFSSPLDVRDLHDASYKCKIHVTNHCIAGGKWHHHNPGLADVSHDQQLSQQRQQTGTEWGHYMQKLK